MNLRTLSTLLAFLVAGSSVGQAAPPLEAGVATIEITPPLGYRMAGYFRERFNTGTHDPLQARAVVFRQGERQAALVFCDLVSIPGQITFRARSLIRIRTGIPEENVAIAATHSHTGPLYHGVLRRHFHERAIAGEGRDPHEELDYPAWLALRLGDVVEKARAALAPVALSVGAAEVPGLAFNRRFHMKDGTVRFNPGALNPDIVRAAGPTDPRLNVVFLTPAPDGKAPIASLTVFALHLDTIGGTEYAADYPFDLERALRAEFGPGFQSLFGAGTCGDINHIDVTKRDRIKTDAIGARLARAVLDSRAGAKPVAVPGLAVARAVVPVPVRKPTDREIAEARSRIGQIGSKDLPFLDQVRAVTTLDLAENYRGPTTGLEVQVFRLGKDLAVVTLPGEVFVELGLAIKAGSPFATTLVIELANQCPAYVPTRKAFEEGSYEVVNSRIAPGGGEMLVDTAITLLKELASE